MDTQGILALAILVLCVGAFKTLDWWIKSKIEATKEKAKTERREQRNTELAEQLGAIVGEQRRLHSESQQQLLIMFREDRAALAQSLVATIDTVGTFDEDDRTKLVKLHNSHLGPRASRTDGSLRWHAAETVEQAVVETRDATRKLVDLATEARQSNTESVRLLARLEARA
jgi:hypothetical protein